MHPSLLQQLGSLGADALGREPPQAAMIDGTGPMFARAARHSLAQGRMPRLVQCGPARVIRRAKERDAGGANRDGQVSWAGGIRDEEIQRADERGQAAE